MKLKFAWWPRTMTSGRRIWFRHYWLYQRSYDYAYEHIERLEHICKIVLASKSLTINMS